MATVTESAFTGFSNPFALNPQVANAVPATTALFNRLSVDQKLAALWVIYTELGKSITPAATGAARLQFAEGLLNQIKQMPQNEQLQAMRDIANKVSNPVSRAYGVLTNNTKLAFWYQLAVWMEDGSVIPVPESYKLSREANQLMASLRQLEMNQQITVLRNAVINMGVDPLA